MTDIIITILTTVTAVASCIAAIAAWYAASTNWRHYRKLRRVKYDAVFVLRPEYQHMPPVKMEEELRDTHLFDYFSNKGMVQIDDRLYFAGDLDFSRGTLTGIINWLSLSVCFEFGYSTKQGKRHWHIWKLKHPGD